LREKGDKAVESVLLAEGTKALGLADAVARVSEAAGHRSEAMMRSLNEGCEVIALTARIAAVETASRTVVDERDFIKNDEDAATGWSLPPPALRRSPSKGFMGKFPDMAASWLEAEAAAKKKAEAEAAAKQAEAEAASKKEEAASAEAASFEPVGRDEEEGRFSAFAPPTVTAPQPAAL
jgi:hypothetical protein